MQLSEAAEAEGEGEEGKGGVAALRPLRPSAREGARRVRRAALPRGEWIRIFNGRRSERRRNRIERPACAAPRRARRSNARLAWCVALLSRFVLQLLYIVAQLRSAAAFTRRTPPPPQFATPIAMPASSVPDCEYHPRPQSAPRRGSWRYATSGGSSRAARVFRRRQPNSSSSSSSSPTLPPPLLLLLLPPPLRRSLPSLFPGRR